MNLIYDNIIFGLQKIGGISIYWHELYKRIKIDENIDLKVIDNYSNKINVSDSTISNNVFKHPKVKLLKKLNLNVSKNDVFHSSYYRINKSCKNITTVHDFTFENFFNIKHSPQILLKRNAILNSDLIICISKNTQRDLLKFYPNIDIDKTRVIYNGVSEDYFPLNDELIFDNKFPFLEKKNYLLFIGSRAKYKNFDIALKIFKNSTIKKFVVIGNPFSKTEANLIKEIKKDVINIQYATNHDLNILYNNANSLIYPSLYEGFGIPVIEAMRAGCHVLANNSSSIHEIGNNHAFLIQNNKIDDYVDIIENLKKFENKDLIELNLKYSNQFSWDNCYDKTKKTYEELS